MTMGRALITGGIGAIGSQVLRKFVEEGARPVVLDLREDFSLVDDIRDRFDFVSGDVRDPAVLKQTVEDGDVGCIVHFSSVLGSVCRSDHRLAWDINVGGTLNILETARQLHVKRVLYASSKAAYGQLTGPYGHPTYKPAGEQHPFRPTSFYGTTKVAAETLGREYRRSYGIEFSAFRFASTYGPGKSGRHTSQSSIGKMIECARGNIPFDLSAGGDQKNDYVYNADLANAVYLAFTARTIGTEYNIGSGKLHTLREAAEIVRRRHRGAVIRIGKGLADAQKPGELSYGLLDIRKAKRELKYIPQFDLEDGIEQYERSLTTPGRDQTI